MSAATRVAVMANGAAPSYPWEVVDSDTGAISSQSQKKRDLSIACDGFAQNHVK